jgi:glucokinase
VNGKRCAVALDVGGTKIACGLFFEDGRMPFQKTVLTSQESADASVSQLVSLALEAVSRAPRDFAAAGVGIIIPGWVNHKARTVWAPNIRGWDHIPLQRKLSDALPLPIVLDSDRNGYVKGEAWLGIARGLTDVVFLAVGTGIGAGILANGRIIHGHEDLAGAVGWLALNPRFQEIYSSMGCFEAEASGGSVGRKGREAFGALSTGSSEDLLTARDVLQATESGDSRALEIVNQVVVYLGMGVANLISTLNPQMIVLGGGLFQSGKYLFDRVRQECVRWAQPFAAQSVRIELSALGEHAGLAGAARIALDNT